MDIVDHNKIRCTTSEVQHQEKQQVIVNVTWPDPENANGPVVTYDIETTKAEWVEVCLSFTQLCDYI